MDAIQESLNQMMQTFNKRLDSIEDQLPKSASTSSSDLHVEFTTFKSFVLTSLRSLQSQIGLLASQVDTLEMRSRRKILLLHGIPEVQNEETSSVIAKAVVQHLKLDEFKKEDISRCHRMGRTVASGRPRPILFKLRDVVVRDNIWSTKIKLKGSGITVSEFLTKFRHDVFLAARQRFGISKCWTREGFVYVLGADGTRHRVHCLADLDAIPSNIVTKPAVASKEAQPAREVIGPAKTRRAATMKK